MDLYVNGRLREKDLLKHIPSTRVVESYLYGQIHFNELDGDKDRFTSSREGVISDDPLFKEFLENLKSIVQNIMKDWDSWRIMLHQDGDPDEISVISRKERKATELFNTVAEEYVPEKSSKNKGRVDDWVNALSNDAQFNLSSYAECFISENLIRKYIQEQNIALSKQAQAERDKWKNKEGQDKNKANISFDIRDKVNDLHYLSMDDLANLVDMHKEHKLAALSRDATTYKPVRDALAHTAILTSIAKQSLNTTYENIKARVKKLLE